MKCIPSRKKFPTVMRDASFLNAEFKGDKKEMATRLALAEDWAANVPKELFLKTKYPIEVFLPIITSKLSAREIANFNIYFMASLHLKRAPGLEEHIDNPRKLKKVKTEKDERFGLDSIIMECSRADCMRRKLCYGARAIKERGGSSYEDWYCYQPQLTEEEAAEWAKAMEERMAAKPVPKKKIVVSPSFTSRQGSHLYTQNKPKERTYHKVASHHPTNQDIKFQVKVTFANQPHGSCRNKCGCYSN